MVNSHYEESRQDTWRLWVQSYPLRQAAALRDGDEILVSEGHGCCFRLDTADRADGLPRFRREGIVLYVCVIHYESAAGGGGDEVRLRFDGKNEVEIGTALERLK